MAAYSQGSAVFFGVDQLGDLLSWEVTPAQAVTADATSQDSTILGAGSSARVVRQVDCVAVDPGTASVTFLGSNGLFTNLVGSSASLTVASEAGVVSLNAILVSFTITAAVGELIKGTANFQFTGND